MWWKYFHPRGCLRLIFSFFIFVKGLQKKILRAKELLTKERKQEAWLCAQRHQASPSQPSPGSVVVVGPPRLAPFHSTCSSGEALFFFPPPPSLYKEPLPDCELFKSFVDSRRVNIIQKCATREHFLFLLKWIFDVFTQDMAAFYTYRHVELDRVGCGKRK